MTFYRSAKLLIDQLGEAALISAAHQRKVAGYVELAERWAEIGATVVGGCCGTGPLHMRALSERFGSGVGGVLGPGP